MQIADDLRRRIDAGDPEPGQRLDTNRALAGRYGASTETVRRALRVLADEGRIQAHSTLGTYVMRQEAPPGAEAGDPDALRRQVDALQVDVMELYARLGYDQPSHHQNGREARREDAG
jgi:GntR family transcriptional regulator